MEIQSIGRTVAFSDLKPGDCYFYNLSGKPAFAIAGRLDEKQGLVGLVFTDGPLPMPWVSYRGHHNSAYRVENAVIRPDLSSLSFGPSKVGWLIDGGHGFYIRASAMGGDTLTVDLKTGLHIGPQDALPETYFSRWSVGRTIDGAWQSIFDFSATPAERNGG
jgi:hypothetical protein